MSADERKDVRFPDLSAGGALRHEIFNKITPILLGCDWIEDSRVRLSIQASCLDMVTVLEDLIKGYQLDNHRNMRQA